MAERHLDIQRADDQRQGFENERVSQPDSVIGTS